MSHYTIIVIVISIFYFYSLYFRVILRSVYQCQFTIREIRNVTVFFSVTAKDYVKLSHDGPVVLGGTITFRADLYTDDGKRPRGTFRYKWTDNSLMKHKYQVIITIMRRLLCV